MTGKGQMMTKNKVANSSFPTFAKFGSHLVQMRWRRFYATRPFQALFACSIILLTIIGMNWWTSGDPAMSPLIHELLNRGVGIGHMGEPDFRRKIHFQIFPPAVWRSPASPERSFVTLSDCNRLDQETWSLISRLELLWSIDLSDTKFNAQQMDAMRSVSGLNDLILSRSNVDDDALEILASFMPQIVELNLDETEISDASVKTLIRSFPKLRTLKISSPNITLERLDELRQARPNLVITARVNNPISQ
jgi:hypothetical protein